MIRDLGTPLVEAVLDRVGRGAATAQECRPLPADLFESGDAYLAVFDAPGAEAGDIQVKFEAGDVVVRVERFRDPREGFELQFPGRGLTLEGQVSLPDDADILVEDATATLTDHGTLRVRVPKVQGAGTSDQDNGQ